MLVQHPILITGAGGSIGSALARRLALAGASIILLESSESSLYDLQQDLAGVSTNVNFYLGSASLNPVSSTRSSLSTARTLSFTPLPTSTFLSSKNNRSPASPTMSSPLNCLSPLLRRTKRELSLYPPTRPSLLPR